jgi:hypothetical protein
MNALYQRLKELDPKAFELFCFHLLQERHPSVEIRHVEGAGGDEGLDVFTGDLDGHPVVWQCKSFPNGMHDSQKEQIRASLRQAVKHLSPRQWILCLSVDMDAKTHRWFEKLKASYGMTVIGLMDAGHIVHELMHRRTLRNAYFPGAALDTAELRQLITRTGELTKDELATLCTENVEQYLERLKDHDARFTYEITFGNDREPQHHQERGLLVSLADEHKTINVFARDTQALKANPVRANMKLVGPGVSKMQEYLRTGSPQEFLPGELASFSSDLDFLLPHDIEPAKTWRLLLNTPKEQLPSFSFRITFGEGTGAVVYELVQFQTVRRGTEEAELRSTTPLPFGMQLTLRFREKNGTINFCDQRSGFSVQQIHRMATAIVAMSNARVLDLYNLTVGKHFLTLSVGEDSEWMRILAEVTAEATTVASFYGVELVWPTEVGTAELETMHRLRELIDGVPIPVSDVTVRLTKTGQLPAGQIREMLKKPDFRFEHDTQDRIRCFGTTIAPGRLEIIMSQCRIAHKNEFQNFLLHAPQGTGFDLKIQTCGLALAKAIPK